MTSTPEQQLLSDVLLAMAEDSEVVDAVVAAARTRSPDVARLPEEENRRHIRILLSYGLASATDSCPADGEHISAAVALGADRAAQGIPIDSLLLGVQAGRAHAARMAVSRGRAAGVPDHVLINTMLNADNWIGAVERHVLRGYHAAKLEMSRTARDLRARLLHRLLHTDDPAAQPSPTEMEDAGVSHASHYHCLVSNISDPVHARTIESRLAAGGGLFGFVNGHLTALVPRLPAVTDLGQQALIVATPSTALADLPRYYRLCATIANTASRRGLSGLHHAHTLAVETALAAQPALGDLLRRTLLGALDPGDEFHQQLVDTALTYFDQGQRHGTTAAALHVHANTVRYRLSRLHELTGIPLEPATSRPPSTLEAQRWWWALRTWLDERSSH
jgi:hypothetical protein